MTVVSIQYEQLHWSMVQQILDEEKSKHASSAQQNDIDPSLFHTILRLE
jgi:rubrerythrin